MHGFTVTRVTPVHDLHFTAVELEHNVTRAKYLHIARAGVSVLIAWLCI